MTGNQSQHITSAPEVSTTSVKPTHLDPAWRYLPLTADRTPIRGYTKDSHPDYWQGITGTWEELLAWTAQGGAMGLLARESGLVVLDCDNKVVMRANGNTATMGYEHGITHLTRVCHELGHDVPPTYAVKTKSGGYHLYYRQHPDWQVRSQGHREDWHVDVKASASVFVVAPPSRSYEVVRDLPVAEMPEWLARYLMRLRSHTQPVGGERARELMREIRDARESGVDLQRGATLHDQWLGWTLDLVRHSQKAWNNRIYVTARQLFDVGYSQEEAEDMLLVAAEPWNRREQHNVRRTVASAWNGHLTKTYEDRHWTYQHEL